MNESWPGAPLPPPPPPPSVQAEEDRSKQPKWWKRVVPLWAVILVAIACIGLGAATAISDDSEVAAGSDADALEGLLADQEAQLSDRAERINELTSQVERLEKDLDETTSSTTPPTTIVTTPTTVPPAAVPPAPEGSSAGETVSQRNARQKAAEYLDFASFSRSGLIEQLKFEGFAQGDAEYGVDALNVDWNEQAAKKAAEYLNFTSFSRSGLIEQLKFDGFTQAQAEYGVSTTGL